MKETPFAALVVIVAVASGCGGASSSTATAPSPQSMSFGDGHITMQGTAKPAVLDFETGLSIASIAGASISSLDISPAKNLNNTSLLFQAPQGDLEMYQHGQLHPISSQSELQLYGIAFGHNGQLYMVSHDPGHGTVFGKMNYDGTGYTPINVGSSNIFEVAVAPNDGQIAFGGYGIATTTLTGSGFTVINSGGFDPCYSPDGKTIAFIANVSGQNQICTIPAAGGAATQLTTDNVNHNYPTYSPDGALIFCSIDNGSIKEIASYASTGGYLASNYYSHGYPWAQTPVVSPDGNYLAFTTGDSYPSPSNYEVVVTQINGDYPTYIGSGSTLAWSPFPGAKLFIGTGGALMTSAAGVLYGQYQSGFASMVAFRAMTPSSATITLVSSSTPSDSGPAVYDLHADAVTAVKYVNGYYLPAVSINSSATDALVSIDTNTGQVTSVSPFTATRNQAVEKSGMRYKAQFRAVYDGKGRNLASKGATTITFDAKTGKPSPS